MKKTPLHIPPYLRVISNPCPTLVSSQGCPKITLIASGKGGVGKTWLSIALSHALAKEGRHVLLFDGDLGFANVDVQLGMMPKHDLAHVLEDYVTLKNAVTLYKEGGFDILAGHSGGGSLSDLNPYHLLTLKKSLKTASILYDTILVDLGTRDTKALKSLCDCASRCVIVIVDEPTSLTDAYTLIKVIHLASPSILIDIVVNQAETELSGQKAYTTLLKVCENFLNISPRLLGIIHKDERVKEAIRSQSSFLNRFPTAKISKEIQKLAERF